MSKTPEELRAAATADLVGRVQKLGVRTLTPDEQRDLARAAEVPEADLPPRVSASRIYLEDLDDADLILLKARIESLLQSKGLDRLDLEGEFLVQLAHARGLQEDLRDGVGKPGERASALTAVNTTLKELVKLRDTVINQQRMSKIEGALVRVMREQPPEVRDEFLLRYREIVAEFEDA